MSYPRTAFSEHLTERLWQLIEAHPLATLAVGVPDTPFVHMPLSLNEAKTHLVGHANPTNPLIKLDNARLHVLFTGPDAYLSPSQITGLSLPTWDYATVHIQGQIREIKHSDDKHAIMKRQLSQFESHPTPGICRYLVRVKLQNYSLSCFFSKLR
ncbi:FMN-binding negative transcriptional regulator [Pseudoalteromonas sp. R3]|uniref:FMN-binding negative transcriptional regulator n=1 Tax=Pseudoalteromonas sp. R3 TaxID=1709477 RepID=UPI000FDDD467|nr:FMN-binding negative transcriptional regulator [Pseudoalteromonas sp. R3]AZZ95702.1 FMN-binding negative transcriptional regulator [Pseudoalteromonas sp. R3]